MNFTIKSLFREITKPNQSLLATRILHGLMIKSHLCCDPFYVTKVVAFYASNNDLKTARYLFDVSPQRTIYLWNSMIRGYARAKLFQHAFVLFKLLLGSDTHPDSRTFACVARASAETLNLESLRNIHGQAIVYGFGPDLVCGSTFVRCYSKLGLVVEAIRVFQGIDKPDLVLLNAMISGYCSSGDWMNGIQLFVAMQHKGIIPDERTMVGLIVGLADQDFVILGEMIFGYCVRCGLISNDHVVSSFVSMFLKFERLESALKVFHNLHEPDLVSWSAMIIGFSDAGYHINALMFFREMLNKGIKPDPVLLARMLSASAQVPALKPGTEVHGYAVRHGCSSELLIASALVDMYGKCGFLNLVKNAFDLMPCKSIISCNIMISNLGLYGHAAEAFKLFDEMMEQGLKPDATTFSGLLSACCHSGLVNESSEYFRIMTEEFGIQPETEHHVYMVKLLGMNGKIQEAYDLIKSLPKPVDCSLWGALLACCDYHQNYDLLEEIEKHLHINDLEKSRYRVMLSNLHADGERWDNVMKLRVEMGGAKGKIAATAMIPS